LSDLSAKVLVSLGDKCFEGLVSKYLETAGNLQACMCRMLVHRPSNITDFNKFLGEMIVIIKVLGELTDPDIEQAKFKWLSELTDDSE